MLTPLNELFIRIDIRRWVTGSSIYERLQIRLLQIRLRHGRQDDITHFPRETRGSEIDSMPYGEPLNEVYLVHEEASLAVLVISSHAFYG